MDSKLLGEGSADSRNCTQELREWEARAMSGSERRIERGVRVFRELQGVWRSHGYGQLLEISPSGYRLCEETRLSCLCVYGGTLEELAAFYAECNVSPEGRAFEVRRATGVTRVRYRKLSHRPGRCKPELLVDDDPVRSFDVFWQTFAERYALFELRGVDWQSLRDEHRPKLSISTRPRQLFEVFKSMLRPLQDGHVELVAPFGRFSPGGSSRAQRQIAKRLGTPPGDPRAIEQVITLGTRSEELVRERYLISPVQRAAHGTLEWARLDAQTGYLRIGAMAGQSGGQNRPREDQIIAARFMERALRDLGGLPTLVVDLRRNPGGYDGVALRLAGYLTDRKRVAFTKAASKRRGYAGKQSIVLEPWGLPRYRGQIVILTSDLTTSAAEIFVLSLLRHPRVIRVGEPTHGELSDVMERHLPNGWRITLSNELYLASDGGVYEDRGVPPHRSIPYLDPASIERGRDPMLDWVLRQRGALGRQRATRSRPFTPLE